MTVRAIYILGTCLFAMMASSCKKNWLDVTNSAEIRTEDQFNTESGFKDALMGVYIGMTHRSLYSKDMTWNLVDLLSQQYNALTAQALYAELQQYKYKTNRSMPRVDALWNQSYNVIANINNSLAYIDKNKSVLHPIHHSLIKGELLGLRAMMHFDLMRLYGYGNLAGRPAFAAKPAIPYVTQLSKEITPQLSYTETFALLEKDLEEALELLKEDPVYQGVGRPAGYYDQVNRDGFYNKRELRMNYYAVRALQARVLCWQGTPQKLEKARTAAEEVIGQSPAKLVTVNNWPGSETILYDELVFALNVTAFTDIISSYFDAKTLENFDALFILVPNAQSLYETQVPSIGFVDKRYNTLLETQSRGMIPVKLAQRTPLSRNVMPLIRIPELYYIAAEYYIGNDLGKAIDYLNTVRSSRGILQNIPSNATEDVVRDELFKEYRKEFIAEGQLFYYYKRTGRTTFPGLPTTTVADDKVYLIPYPDTEVEIGNRIQ